MKPTHVIVPPFLLPVLAATAFAVDSKPCRPVPPAQLAAAADTSSVQSKPALEDGTREARAVLKALAGSSYKFTPEVRSAFLTLAKARALAEIRRAGQAIPADFLNWIDSDPVVAATVYGIPNTAAGRLVVLRSLELDLGKEEVRSTHLQLALSLADLHAGRVDPATMANGDLGISLRERGLLELRITRYPCDKVNTRAADRPLDMNDHIINFLEDHPVTTEKMDVREAAGKKVESIEKTTRPAFAYEVYSSPARVKQFNDYMTARGFPMALDCGKGQIVPAHWGGGRDIVKAYKLFRAAYEAKGLLPQKPDPRPTPAELAAYLIRNDNYRFPPEVKRGWPRFPLNAPWPVLDFLVRSGESLREREFVWDRFRTTGSVVGYGAYIGQIAQYPDLVKARKLQPFDFTYDTYPMRLKDGGVCGTCSNIGRVSSIALGVPAAQASQPSHSCFVAVGGNEEKGFGLSIGQSVSGPGSTSVSGRGRYLDQAITFYPINHGLLSFLDCRTAMEVHRLLPAATPEHSRLALLTSAFEINPYHLPAVAALVKSLSNPVHLVSFWQKFEQTLAAIDKPGCPKTGHYNAAVQKELDACFTRLAPPTDIADLKKITAFLETRADAVWLKYQLAAIGLPRLKEKLALDLRTSIGGPRTPQSCALLSGRLALAGAAIKNPKERAAWGSTLLDIMTGHETYAPPNAPTRFTVDPMVGAVYALGCDLTKVKAAFASDLEASAVGPRTAASTRLLALRLNALIKGIRNPKERKAWAETLLPIIAGKESYAITVTLPKNQGTRQSEAEDPCAPPIYQLLGRQTPARIKAEEIKRAAAAAKAKAALPSSPPPAK